VGGGIPAERRVAATLLELDQRNVAGEGRRPANVNRVLPINFCGGPDEIVAHLKQCREQIGVGVVNLSFQTPGSEHPDQLIEALELFGKKVLPPFAGFENQGRRQWQPGSPRVSLRRTGFASGIWRRGKGRHSQQRERLQYGALQSIGDDAAYG